MSIEMRLRAYRNMKAFYNKILLWGFGFNVVHYSRLAQGPDCFDVNGRTGLT